MTVFAYDLRHKKQSKLNDCWYASIQMLKTQANGGVKTKTSGTHSDYLHSGPIGHRLNADTASKHYQHVIDENGLKCLPRAECPLYLPNKVLEVLKKYGPIMVGGTFGSVLWMKHRFGHYIVLAGVDTDRLLYKINDPNENRALWVAIQEVANNAWTTDPYMFVVDPD